ncbi:hypothetical protein SBV1_370046 [Verrucomicrobia bacterium]|nr:hypothetical protein SBV1_370046 [Verrucomicrobiota bacterium]
MLLYHLTIDTDRFSDDEVASLIASAALSKCCPSTARVPSSPPQRIASPQLPMRREV